MLDLLRQIVQRSDRGEPLVVCTLVRTRGSTPQKAGAVMVVLANGHTLGTIGGGCVEAEVRTRALQLMSEPADRLLSFKLNHDLGWDDGLICGGTMEVAVQVLTNPEHARTFRMARDNLAAGQRAELAIDVRDEGEAAVHFSLPLQPSPTLIIIGAGHVGAALATIAGQLDFNIVVIDDRADYASTARFPNATILVGPTEASLAKLDLTDQTYIVIVTRGHRGDALALAAVVRSSARYIGLIGSRRKILQITGDLSSQGVPPEKLGRVHAPIGLDIGATTPGEIAVSIAAELIAVRHGKSGEAIHSMRLSPRRPTLRG